MPNDTKLQLTKNQLTPSGQCTNAKQLIKTHLVHLSRSSREFQTTAVQWHECSLTKLGLILGTAKITDNGAVKAQFTIRQIQTKRWIVILILKTRTALDLPIFWSRLMFALMKEVWSRIQKLFVSSLHKCTWPNIFTGQQKRPYYYRAKLIQNCTARKRPTPFHTMHAVLQISAGGPYPAPINTSKLRYWRVWMSSEKWWNCIRHETANNMQSCRHTHTWHYVLNSNSSNKLTKMANILHYK